MSLSSPSFLSANASEFVPSFPTNCPAVSTKDETNNTGTGTGGVRQKEKKTREMRGPRKRHKKPKGDINSVSTTITQSQYGDYEEDDVMSYLSLEASYPIGIECYDHDFLDSSASSTPRRHNNGYGNGNNNGV